MPPTIPKSLFIGKGWSQLAIPLILVGVGLGSFGLGRLSMQYKNDTVKIYAPALPECARIAATPQPAPSIVRSVGEVEGNFFASQSGTKYYPAQCASVSRIQAAHRVWYRTAEDAVAAGLTAGFCSAAPLK